jgi:hypothetical protein
MSPAGGTSPAERSEDWLAVLEAMELEADAVEQMLRHRDMMAEQVPDPGVFPPPPGVGPLPLPLTERARALVQRQLDLSRELSIAIAGNRQQARLVARLQREGPPPPVYLDNRS